ncbi:MAG: hypothetical protein Q9183_007054, partial [Haloplaca sp. 2 TL-2023]
MNYNANKNATTSAVPAFDDRPASVVDPSEYSSIPKLIAPIWPVNSSLDISIYVSPSFVMPALDTAVRDSLVLEEKDFTLGDFDDHREIDTTFKVPPEVQNNGTLWAHFYVALHGHSLDPGAGGYDAAKAHHFSQPLNQIIPKKKVAKTRKLVGASDGDDEKEVEE